VRFRYGRWILPDPIFVSGIREYRSGDNRKDVHWGATARTGILQVKIRDYTVSPKVLIVFNTQISDQLFGGMNPEDVEFLEKGINICAALAAWCINMGLEVGFLSNGAAQFGQSETPVLESGSTQAHLKVLLRMLATLVIKMQTGIHTLLDRQIKEWIFRHGSIDCFRPTGARFSERAVQIGTTAYRYS
jgi:hypothetical protein